jgi:hypothetical protein
MPFSFFKKFNRRKFQKKLFVPQKTRRWFFSNTPFSNYAQAKKKKRSKFKKSLTTNQSYFSKFKKIFSYSFISATIGLVIYALFFSHLFLVTKWEIIEKDVSFINHPLAEFAKTVQGQNIFFINATEIETAIQKSNPQYSQVQVSRKLPNTIEITVQSYPLLANLSNTIIGESKIEQKLIINNQGIVIEKDNSNPELPTIEVESTKSFNLYEKTISQENLEYALNAQKEFEENFGLKINRAILKLRERELHLLTEKQFVIWLDMEKKSSLQFAKLKHALPKIDIYETELSYIDLRIFGAENDRVIYKRK